MLANHSSLRVALLSILIGLSLETRAGAAPRALSLDEAVQEALAHQPQLQSALAQTKVGQARVGEAKAGFLPRLDVQAQYQRSTTNFLLSPLLVNTPLTKNYQAQNALSPADTVNYYAFGVTATQMLYDFGKTPGLVSQAEAAAEASQADVRLTAQTITLNVRVAYYTALAGRQFVEVGERAVHNQQKHVDQIRHFVEIGNRVRFDLSSAELNLANAELGLVRARNAHALAMIRLNTAMGLDSPADFELSEPAELARESESQPVQALVDAARQQRPEIARLESQLRLQGAAKRVVRAGYLPVLTGVGNLSGTGVEGFDAGFDWYVGATLSWNLFNGLLTLRQSEEADAAIEVATAQRETVRLTIRAEIEEQLLASEDAKQRQLVAERAVVTARERLEQAEDRYQTGAGEAIDLDDAQVTLANAESQQVQARYDLAIARARLLRAVGAER